MPNEPKLKNPYEEEIVEPKITVSRRACWIFTGVFVALIMLAPFFRNVIEMTKEDGWVPVAEFFHRPSPESENLLARKKLADPRISRETPNFIDHREAWEKELENAEFIAPVRQTFQTVLTNVFREGNRKTVIGKDGWLFFRPAIDSLTGYGPLKSEPDSVAKDPTRPPWQGPKEAIFAFW